MVILSTVFALIVFAFPGDQTGQQDAHIWRKEKIASLNAQLVNTDGESDQRLEWLAQRAWLESWQPGEMNGARKLIASKSKLLIDEPSLADLDRPAGISFDRWHHIVNLQSQLWDLDSDENRKQNLKTTIPLAEQLEQALVAELDIVDQTLDSQVGWALAFVRYRLGRAIAYRELPDVIDKWPIENQESYNEQLDSVVERLRTQAADTRPEFILLEDRMLRRAGWRGRALWMLERHRDFIEPKWYLKKRRDLLGELGWDLPQQEAARIYSAAGFD